MSTNCGFQGSLMKLISLSQDPATSTQVDALFEPLQMALSRVSEVSVTHHRKHTRNPLRVR